MRKDFPGQCKYHDYLPMTYIKETTLGSIRDTCSVVRTAFTMQVCYGTFCHKTKWVPLLNVSNQTPCLFLLKV